ncbi:PorT family protein [Hoylesella buccalis]|uniref:outer membrane beta-barrel protein n=1 Tax=Hoylesella buccalis TaxID=28127 RepID=UPI001D132C2F|nr:outer membrane beta-barrel protein [Hoylesella buccalis]UEA62108.1 PorT family protein [Hoylesella buccalis]UWP50609.1 PorT family protein [Hoylesella buccalis ATCC 35310]
MKNDDWIKDIQRRIADHQEPVKDDLWAGIEQALDQQKIVGKPAVVMRWRRYAAAAAIVLALMGGAGYVLFNHQEQMGKEVARTETEQQPAGLQPSTQQIEPMVLAEQAHESVVSRVKKALSAVRRGADSNQPLMALVQEKAAEPSDRPQDLMNKDMEKGGQPEESSAETAAKVAEQPQPSAVRKNEGGRPSQTFLPAERQRIHGSRQDAKVTMNLYAANSVGTYSGRNGLAAPAEMVANYNLAKAAPELFYAEAASPIALQSHEETDHHQPVSFGLTAGYALNQRWTLTSGLVYTKLSSDFIQVLDDSRLTRRQTLHYVGIPLNVNFMVWGNKKLKTYVTAGGQVDFNVDAKTVKEGIKHDMPKDKLQLSTQAALGLQYDFTPHLGAYFEPGVKYYFDNKSETQNFFKDKPLNVHLQVGLRWNIQ